MPRLVDAFLVFFFRYCHWFVRIWYGLTMRLTRKRGVTIPKYSSASEIADALGRGRNWVSDPLGGVLDILRHPYSIQKNLGEATRSFDCDEHGIYWCYTLIDNALADEVFFCTLQGWRTNGKRVGHVITTFRKGDQWYCMDYGNPYPIANKWNWVEWYGPEKVVAAVMYPVIRINKRGTPMFGRAQVRTRKDYQ